MGWARKLPAWWYTVGERERLCTAMMADTEVMNKTARQEMAAGRQWEAMRLTNTAEKQRKADLQWCTGK